MVGNIYTLSLPIEQGATRMEIAGSQWTVCGADLAAGTRVKVVKNKVAPPFKQAEFDILYGEGVSLEGEIIKLGTEAEIIQKSGAWYSYNGEKIGQGKEKVRTYLKENPHIAEEIENAIREKFLAGQFVLPENHEEEENYEE